MLNDLNKQYNHGHHSTKTNQTKSIDLEVCGGTVTLRESYSPGMVNGGE